MTEEKDTQIKFDSISKQMEQRIKSGIYVSAQKLPSEYDLAREFGVSRLTVRKAVQDLIEKQIVMKKKGIGTYVIAQRKIPSGRLGLQSFTEAAKTLGKESQTKIITFKAIKKAPKVVIEALKTSENIVELIRVRSLDKNPMILEKIYITQSFVEGAEPKVLEGSLFTWIEQKVEIAYSHQEIEAALATKTVALRLGISEGSAVFCVHSTTYSIDAKPIFHDVSYYRSDKYTFSNTLIRKH